MSTLCRAGWDCRNVRGARPFYRAAATRRRTRSLGGASRAALPDKDVFGGTPNTARETRALPTHPSAFLKGRVKGGRVISDFSKYFGNISEKQPFSEIISDYFFWQSLSKWACRAVALKAVPPNYFRGSGRRRVKASQSESNRFGQGLTSPKNLLTIDYERLAEITGLKSSGWAFFLFCACQAARAFYAGIQ